MKKLNGGELADYIKERQIRQVRALRQAWHVLPKVVIIQTTDDPVISTYVRLKQAYGDDVLIDVDVRRIAQAEVASLIDALNADETVHGIVVQLPLESPAETDEVLSRIAPQKDVDGLTGEGTFISATATAIDWLLAGYNVDTKNSIIAIVGEGRLVGAPLAALWRTAQYNVTTYDESTTNLGAELRKAQLIVSATGVPGLITTDMISPGAVVVDAGTATTSAGIVGDLDPEVRERDDIVFTPARGGVGPLTIAALFDAVILAAQRIADEKKAAQQ